MNVIHTLNYAQIKQRKIVRENTREWQITNILYYTHTYTHILALSCLLSPYFIKALKLVKRTLSFKNFSSEKIFLFFLFSFS